MEQRLILILLRFFWRIVTCYPFNQPGFHGNATLEFQILNKAHFWNGCVPTNLNTDLGGLSIRISPICANSWGLKPDWWIDRIKFQSNLPERAIFSPNNMLPTANSPQVTIFFNQFYGVLVWIPHVLPNYMVLILAVPFHYRHPSPVQWGVIQTRRLAPSKGSMRWWGVLGCLIQSKSADFHGLYNRLLKGKTKSLDGWHPYDLPQFLKNSNQSTCWRKVKDVLPDVEMCVIYRPDILPVFLCRY